jgi:hypothetical protein
MVEFMKWARTDGQKFARALSYAPLPAALAETGMKALQRIKVQS